MTRISLASPTAEFSNSLSTALGELQVDTVEVRPSGLDAGDPEGAAAELAAGAPELVLLGPDIDLGVALEVAEVLDVKHPDIAVILVAKPTQDTLERALHAGTRGVLSPDSAPREMESAIHRALAASRRRREAHGTRATSRPANRVVPVLAAKGGSGKTTVASNLAVALAHAHPGEVVLVDLDLQFGDVASAFGVDADYTFADVGRLNGNFDATTLKTYLTPKQAASLYLLAGPDTPAQADDLNPARVAEAVALLSKEFPYVIVDTAAGIDEYTLEVLDLATDLVLLSSMDVPSVRATAKEIDALEILGMNGRPWHLVLNRATAKVGLSVDDIETTLGRTIDVRVPSSRQIPLSVNRGEPLTIRDRRSAPGRAFEDLARRVDGSAGGERIWRKKWRTE